MKSAAVAEALRPLRRRAATAADEYEQAVTETDARRADLEFRIAALKKEAGKKREGGFEDIAREVAELQAELRDAVPTERRYMTQDATVEKLGELLKHNPRGLLLVRDELAG